jgi:plastocyanin
VTRIWSNGVIPGAIGMLFVVVSCAGPEGRDGATTGTEAPTTSEVVGTSTTSAPVSTSSTLARLDSVTQIDAAEPPGSLSVEMANAPFRFLPEALAVPPGDAVFFLMNTAPGSEIPIHTMAIGPSRGEIMAVSPHQARGLGFVHGVGSRGRRVRHLVHDHGSCRPRNGGDAHCGLSARSLMVDQFYRLRTRRLAELLAVSPAGQDLLIRLSLGSPGCRFSCQGQAWTGSDRPLKGTVSVAPFGNGHHHERR